MGEALGETLASMLEMLLPTVGENDLIPRLDDPGKKVFSFDLLAPDGSPIHSFGTTDHEPYRIVRMLEHPRQLLSAGALEDAQVLRGSSLHAGGRQAAVDHRFPTDPFG